MRILTWLLSLVLLVSGVAIAAEPGVYTQDKPQAVVTADNPELVVKLKSNPTTGFSWFLREYNASLLEPVKHEFVPPNNKLVGAPGFELWTFRARPDAFIVPQQTMIHFIYARPWETADTSTQVIFKVSTAQSKPADTSH